MPFFISDRIADHISLTIWLFVPILLGRIALEFVLTRGRDPQVVRRRRFAVRTLANTLLALALVAIWMSELQSLVLSLTAVLVALVVATKELLMCAAGAVLRFGGHLFKVGDRIEIAGIHGEVIDHGLFSTTIMELPPARLGHAGTGRTVMLPNSILLAGPVRVEAQPRQFAPHRFTLTFDQGIGAAGVLAAIEAAADAALQGDAELASRFHRMTANKAGAEIEGPGRTVSATTSELGKLQFNVMIYCLVRNARALEHAITLAALASVEERMLGPALDLGRNAGPRATSGEVRAWDEITRQLRDNQSKEGHARERRTAAA